MNSKWLGILLLSVVAVVIWLGQLDGGGDGGSVPELATDETKPAPPVTPLDYEPPMAEDSDPARATAEESREPTRPDVASREVVDAPGATRLVVTVLDSVEHRPVPGAMVAVRWAENRRWKSVTGSAGKLGEAPLTDESGVATLEVPANRALDLDVLSQRGTFARQSFVVDGLAPGTVRELSIDIQPKNPGEFFGRVVAGEDGTPIVGAEVRFRTRPNPLPEPKPETGWIPATVTGRDGCFDLLCSSLRSGAIVIAAPGRLTETVTLSSVTTSPRERYEVRLLLGARLEGMVTGRPPGVESLRVRLCDGRDADYFFGNEWSALVEPGGVFAIDGIPPGLSLHAAVLARGLAVDGEPKRRTLATEVVRIPSGQSLGTRLAEELLVHLEPEPLILEPGEVRRVEWHLAPEATIAGQVLGEDGESMPGLSVYLLPSEQVRLEHFASATVGQGWQPGSFHEPGFGGVRTTTTDSQGLFSFSWIAAGEWALAAKGAADTVAIVSRVTVAPGVGTAEVTLLLRRGEFITGRVLDVSGKNATRITVRARGLEGGAWGLAFCDERGSFRLGPLLPGRYEVVAAGQVSTTRRASAKVEVDSGETGLLLRLDQVVGTPPGTNAAGAPGSGGF